MRLPGQDLSQANNDSLTTDARWALAQRVVRSPRFVRAAQLCEILLFIVRETILNPEEPIHECDIARHALGRGDDFNPVDDNVVRVRMVHVRRKLAEYFAAEGNTEQTIIIVPLGQYTPAFVERVEPQSVENDPQEVATETGKGSENEPAADAAVNGGERSPDPGSPPVKFQADRANIALIAAALVCGVLIGWGTTVWVKNSPFQKPDGQAANSAWKQSPAVSALWSNLLEYGRSTDVVLGDDSFILIQQITHRIISFDDYESRSYLLPSSVKNTESDVSYPLQLIASKDLGNTNEFMMVQHILSLDPAEKNLHMYSSRQYSLTLMQQDNIILIGGSITDPWEKLFESHLNFYAHTELEGLGRTSIINRAPKTGEQASYGSPGTSGYCAIAFLPKPNGTGKLLILQGTTSEATEAAGDFLVSEEKMQRLLKTFHTATFPYFEVLLRIPLVRGAPLGESIEASRTYPNLK